jgi:DNA-binding NtrC family response regulator
LITNKLFILSPLDALYKLGRYKTMVTSNGKSIVVVDDERDIVNQIKRSLEAMGGLKVYTFTDPFAALEHFSSGCKERDDNNLSLDVLPDVKIDTFLQKSFSLDTLTNIVAIPR